MLAATEGQGRRIKPEFVNYAKRAKRVDVRKLKENIWKGLDIVVSGASEDPGMVRVVLRSKTAMMSDLLLEQESKAPTDPSEARQFDSVITNLQQSYPQEKMAEISTSFCFICLLHLANERGLKIEVGKDKGDEEEVRDVGDLWGLKVLYCVLSFMSYSLSLANLGGFLLRCIVTRTQCQQHDLHLFFIFPFFLLGLEFTVVLIARPHLSDGNVVGVFILL